MSGHTESALGRLALVSLFALAPRFFFKTEVTFPEGMAVAPHTYLAITHKRDIDAMAPVPYLLKRRGWHSLTHEVHFATRADAFAPGFLARLVLRPRWFSHVLRPISVGPILRGVGVHPLHGLHLRPLETWVREWLAAEGDGPTGNVLSQDTIALLAEAHRRRGATTQRDITERLAAQPLSRLLEWRYHTPMQRLCGTEIFADSAHRSAVRRAILEIERQIGELADCLRSGHSLYTSPEGRLSPDGLLSPIPGGLARLLEVAPADTRVQPIAIVYDFIHTGRVRMLVDVASPIEGGAQLSPKELAERLRAAWLEAMRFTCTQLATGVLVGRAAQPGAGWTLGELTHEVGIRARDLAQSGRLVDPRLLEPQSLHERVAGYVRYLARRKLVQPVGGNRWQLAIQLRPIQLPPGDVGYNREPLTYAWNELQDMLSLLPAGAPEQVHAAACESDEESL
jgi:hypothetical protein